MLAPCGLDCCNCDIFLAPQHPEIAEKLLAWFQKQGRTDARLDWFHCCGCPGEKSEHWSADCAILACCVDEKHLASCSDCPEFSCQRLEEWAQRAPKYQAAVARLVERKR